MKSASKLVDGPKVRKFVSDSFTVYIPKTYTRVKCNILGILHKKLSTCCNVVGNRIDLTDYSLT